MIIDEFDFLLPEEDTRDFTEVSKEYVVEAKGITKNPTLYGVDSKEMLAQMTFCPTANAPWEHVTFYIDTNKLVDISGAKVKEIKFMHFIEEIQTKYAGASELGMNNYAGNVIESVGIGKNTVIIGEDTFSYYRKLKTITFEDGASLMILGARAFTNCESLTVLDLSKCTMLERLPCYLLSESAVKTLKISENIRTIDKKAFEYSNLEKVVVGNTKYDFKNFYEMLEENNFNSFWVSDIHDF